MVEKTKRSTFILPLETLAILDKKKIEYGFGDRTTTLKNIIHNANGKEGHTYVSRDYILSMTMVFCVGILRANLILEIVGGAFMIYLFARSTKN